MKGVRRFYIPGACYFFTIVSHQRQRLFCTEPNIQRLRSAFQYAMKKNPFQIQAIVILPDHIHCIWQLPEDDADYSTRWKSIKHYFSIGISAEVNQRREKAVWQKRFLDHLIRHEEDWQHHLDYIHYNPVKHGYVKEPAAWPYSSFLRYVKKGMYDINWGVKIPDTIQALEWE